MLNFYKNLTSNNTTKSFLKNKIKSNTIKNFPPSIREWNNSLFYFNKNSYKFIPETHNLTIKLIKSYFNLYNNTLDNTLRESNLKKRLKRLSSNKIYISNGTFKHTNDKVYITLYTYNRQKSNYIYNIRRKFNKFLLIKLIENILLLKIAIKNLMKEIEEGKSIIIENLKDENKLYFFNNYESLCLNYYNYSFYNEILKKYKKYFLYKELLFINKSKFNYNYLTYLSFLLKKIYNKNIHFNIINLKSFYLNSDIFTESVILKIRRNRRGIVRKLKHLIVKSKIYPISKFITYKPISINKLNLKTEDSINHLVLNKTQKKKKLKKTILNLIKYKRVTGVRIEAKGRLTRRYTASRSVSKFRYKGNLVNIDSSYLGLSSVLLKGNLKGNIQYTKLNSKTRIGSFGLKGWVSGY